MSGSTYAVTVVVASALLGLWLAVRFDTKATTARGAFLCFAGAWMLPGLAAPLLYAAVAHVPPAFAVLLTVLPVLTGTFVLAAAAMRYLAGLMGEATR
jgi:hypothetical protein